MRVRVYNKTLSPDLWDENQNLKPEVYQALLKVSKDFYASTDLTQEPEDILLLGSSVGYNWTPQSDADVHILIDVEKEKLDPETFRKFLDGLAYKWNTEHEIYVKGHKIEVYLQDINEENHSIGVYSLMDNQWIRKPCPQRVVLDKEKIRGKYSRIRQQITDFIQSQDVDKLKALMKAIRNYRQAGLDRAGEFSTENVVFKALRHSGELTRLKDAINSIYDKQTSIDEIKFGKKEIPYAIIGIITDDFNIVAEKDYSGLLDHNGIKGTQYLDAKDIVKWRYKSSTGELFWWSIPDHEHIDEVRRYLRKKYGIEKTRNVFGNQAKYFHGGLGESVKGKPFLIVGVVSDSLEIVAKADYSGGLTHSQMFDYDVSMERPSGRLTHWRYKSFINTIFWWEAPTDDQKEQVILWLAEKHNVKRPKHIIGDGRAYLGTGHDLFEYGEGVEVWAGTIDPDYEIRAIHSNLLAVNHKQIPGYNPNDKGWRWKEDTNFVFWWSEPDEEDKQAVTDFIKRKTGKDVRIHRLSKRDFERSEQDDVQFLMHSPHMTTPSKYKLREMKHDPLKMKEMWFVTYGGMSPTKQKGYDPRTAQMGSMHSPPSRRGFYAFVWPFVEQFLLGGGRLVDPKARGKGTRNRLKFVRDKEGNVITSDHPEFEKQSEKDKYWSLTRTKDNKAEPEEKPEGWTWDDYKHLLYQQHGRKKFQYDGPLWHHLGQHLRPDKIWDRKGAWVKTDMQSYKEALRKELIGMKNFASHHGLSGFRGTTLDHLEVFIDQRV